MLFFKTITAIKTA